MTDETKQNDTAATSALFEHIAIEHTKDSRVSISGEIPVAAVLQYRGKALKKLAQNFEAPGFRKGHAPEHVIVEKYGEPLILKEVAESVLAIAYPQIVLNHSLDVVGQPSVSLTKLAPGNPIGFTIHSAVMPKPTLPDYRALAKKILKEKPDASALVVTDEEVEKVINNIRQTEAHQKWHAEHPEDTEHAHGDMPESEWPALTDDMVKKLGDFANVEEFKKKISEQLGREKELKVKDELRGRLIEAILEKTEVVVPEIFIDGELSKMIAEFKEQIARMGLSLETYLERMKKSEADMKSEWRPEAEKRAKVQLVLNEIALKENLKADEEKVARDVAHLKEMYPDAEEERIRIYVESVQTNEKVLQFLEKEEA